MGNSARINKARENGLTLQYLCTNPSKNLNLNRDLFLNVKSETLYVH